MERNLGKVLITGADGFIGSHLVDKIVKQGGEVTALCCYNSFGSYGWLNPYARDTPKNLHLILGDVRDSGFMDDLTKGHQTVFHLASLIAIPYSYLAPESYIDTNIIGALNVAKACLKHGVERLIHTSTSEVYGTARVVPINESHPLQGQSPYSASKIGADVLMESFFRSFNLPLVTLRPFNTYGPRQSLRAVIPTVIAQCLNKTSEIRLGNITPTRDFNFVSDTANAFYALATISDNHILGETFNAGSGREISIGDLVMLIAQLLDLKISLKVEADRLRPATSEVDRLLCDASKLTRFTGWKSEVSLEAGLVQTIEWMKTSNYSDVSTKYHV